jgi:hypothetical protein
MTTNTIERCNVYDHAGVIGTGETGGGMGCGVSLGPYGHSYMVVIPEHAEGLKALSVIRPP